MASASLASALLALFCVTVAVDEATSTGIKVVLLRGSPAEMGSQYGSELRHELRQSLDYMISYAMRYNVSYDALARSAEQFHLRYSYSYDAFLNASARASNLSLTDVKILNAMETLGLETISRAKRADDRLNGACAFLYVPPRRTVSGRGLVGRNYDYPAPFDELSRRLVVAVFGQADKVAVATIGMPGQVYCPTCVSETGVLIELNNGGPTGGFYVETRRKSMLVNMLEFMQQAGSYDLLLRQLAAAKSDYSLIVNTANATRTVGFEYASSTSTVVAGTGERTFEPSRDDLYSSTNFFQNESWFADGAPTPNDASTWHGVTRRRNLLTLASATDQHTSSSVRAAMEVRIEDGGALWNNTIYQVVVDLGTLDLYIRSRHDPSWTELNLSKLFEQIRR